jgi:acyl carrier protein
MAENSAPELENLEEHLLELISEQLLEVPAGFDAKSNLYDAGLDSMAIMQLLLLIEQNFGVMLPDSDLSRENFSDVRHVAALIREHAAQQA